MAQLGVDLARSLASQRSPQPTAVSCYLNLDPSTIPTTGGLASHVTSIADELRRTAHASSKLTDHEHGRLLREDAERVAAFLETGLDRSGVRGVALFASSELDRWTDVRLPGPVADAVHVGRTFVLAPLLDQLEHDREVIVVGVGRDRGVLWRLRQDEATTIEDLSRHGHGQHDQGGWSQANYQRSIDKDALEHMRRVAEAASALVRPGSGMLLVVACAEEHRSVFDRFLAPHARQAVLGFVEIEKQDDALRVKPRAWPLLEAHLRAERELLLERWREELGHESGRAAAGWHEIIAAAWDGSIESVLVDGRTRAAYECPTCGRGHGRSGRCELDGSPLEEALGGALELVSRGTLVHGGVVRAVPDDVLGSTDGAAALLRYPTASASPPALSARHA
jgi:peptide chain release factor subunit 1